MKFSRDGVRTPSAANPFPQFRINGRIVFSTASLGGLLVYMLVAQYLTPGFTGYWGYLVAQAACCLIVLVAAESYFADQGGISWLTHLMVVGCTYADVLGTDGNLYSTIDEYDKLTHFFGVAALTAFLYDCGRALHARGDLALSASTRAGIAVAIGVSMGIAWEIYELIGDKVFATARVGGIWDTSNDLLSDTLGAVAVAVLLLQREIDNEFGFWSRRKTWPDPAAELQRSDQD